MYAQEKIKPYNEVEDKGQQVERMFDGIAHSYDLLNHLLSMGIDRGWRRKTIKALLPFKPATVLDIATGTGDFAILEAKLLEPQRIIGADLSEGMMEIGRQKVEKANLSHLISFQKEDCMKLSFADKSFDAVTVAYGVRNYSNLEKGLQEMSRVLKDGGHVAILELCTPRKFPMKQLFWVYSHVVMPLVGKLVSKDASAYSYLPATMEAFPQGEVMKEIMERNGFKNVSFKRFTFGLSTMYIGEVDKETISPADEKAEAKPAPAMAEEAKSEKEQYGLIGFPLVHSFSKKFFSEKFANEGTNAEYLNFEIESVDGLMDIIKSHPQLKGLNVTIPHKQNVMPLLNEMSNEAQEIGAVNCIRITRNADGTPMLKGFNADVIGFERSIKPLLKPQHKKALVLGTGGASKAINYGLKRLGLETTFVSRTPREGMLSYEQLTKEIMDDYTIVVNCSPLGTFPKVDTCPDIPYELLTKEHLLYDLVYNPEKTLFLQKGEQQGATIKNGLEMLHLQALASWEMWNTID